MRRWKTPWSGWFSWRRSSGGWWSWTPERASTTPRRSDDFAGDPGHLGTPGDRGCRGHTSLRGARLPPYADLVVERIVAAVARLESHPLSGRVVPEVGDQSLREIIQGSYRIVYRVNRDVVEIVTVFHGARLLRLE